MLPCDSDRMASNAIYNNNTANAGELALPVQWVFKAPPAPQRCLLTLRRVVAGNAEPLQMQIERAHYWSAKAKYTTQAEWSAACAGNQLPQGLQWVREAGDAAMAQYVQASAALPQLVELFAPKGKIEIYSADAPYFPSHFIAKNTTLKIYAAELADTTLLLRLMAQHIDYPFGTGERRHSTSRLFDMCFTAEKALVPNGLSHAIDVALQHRGVLHPQLHTISPIDHARALVRDGKAAINTAYERVLQRERFAQLVLYMAGVAHQGVVAPILQHYMKLLMVDMAIQHKQPDGYPPKACDNITERLHLPLVQLLEASEHEHRRFTDRIR